MSKLSTRKILALIFIFTIVIRFVFVVFAYKDNQIERYADDKNYLTYAESVLEKGPFVFDNQPDIVKIVGPVLPWIIAVMILVFGKSWLHVYILNAVIGSITCILIYYLGKEVFNRKVGLFAAWWSAIYILFIKYVPSSGKDIWLIFFFTLYIYIFLKQRKNQNMISGSLVSGLIFSLMIHLDERYFAYFPLFLLFMILLDNVNWKIGLKKAAIFFLAVIILMIPWLIRNYRAYGRIVILTSRTTVFTDKLLGYERLPAYHELKFGGNRWYINPAQIDSVVSMGTNVRMRSGRPISDDQVVAMQAGIIPKPMSRLEKYWSALNNLWQPIDLKNSYFHTGYRFDGKWSLKHNLGVGLTYGMLLPFFFLGLLKLVKTQPKLGIFFISILVLHTLIHILFIVFTRNRYRIPIDPLIIITAFSGFLAWLRKTGSEISVSNPGNILSGITN